MSRLATRFAQCLNEGRKAFIPFITAGDPDLETTRALILELSRAGATLIELGVPFSDPMADGPVIQRASERALRNSFRLEEIFRIASETQAEADTPLILFSYLNPLLQFGLERVALEAQRSGIDGVLVTDLTPEESGEFSALLRAQDLDLIFLVAPTSTDARLQLVAQRASGFIYAVSRAGVTGVRESTSEAAEKLVNRVRKFSNLPVAVGFGISTATQVADVWRYADGAVVGSAIVAEIERLAGSPLLPTKIGEFARQLLPSSPPYR